MLWRGLKEPEFIIFETGQYAHQGEGDKSIRLIQRPAHTCALMHSKIGNKTDPLCAVRKSK
jgi:hypothetical protein